MVQYTPECPICCRWSKSWALALHIRIFQNICCTSRAPETCMYTCILIERVQLRLQRQHWIQTQTPKRTTGTKGTRSNQWQYTCSIRSDRNRPLVQVACTVEQWTWQLIGEWTGNGNAGEYNVLLIDNACWVRGVVLEVIGKPRWYYVVWMAIFVSCGYTLAQDLMRRCVLQ
jgi:hypothetical protein